MISGTTNIRLQQTFFIVKKYLTGTVISSLKQSITLGPTYYEFAYYKHPATASRFFLLNEHFYLTSMFTIYITMSTIYNEHIFIN